MIGKNYCLQSELSKKCDHTTLIDIKKKKRIESVELNAYHIGTIYYELDECERSIRLINQYQKGVTSVTVPLNRFDIINEKKVIRKQSC